MATHWPTPGVVPAAVSGTTPSPPRGEWIWIGRHRFRLAVSPCRRDRSHRCPLVIPFAYVAQNLRFAREHSKFATSKNTKRKWKKSSDYLKDVHLINLQRSWKVCCEKTSSRRGESARDISGERKCELSDTQQAETGSLADDKHRK